MGGYVARSDPGRGLAVWCWQGREVTAAQWAGHIQDMITVRSWPNRQLRSCILIHLVDSSFVPNAEQRRQLGEAASHPEYTPSIAVVTSNPLIRGVLHTFSWLKQKQAHRIQAFAQLSDGVRWLERERDAPLPALLVLLAQAHRAMGLDPKELERVRDSVAHHELH